MNEQEYKKTMTVTELIALRQFSNEELAAFNIAIQLYGRVQPENLSFEKAVKFKLIKDDGYLWDAETLKTACAMEVNARQDRGEW